MKKKPPEEIVPQRSLVEIAVTAFVHKPGKLAYINSTAT